MKDLAGQKQSEVLGGSPRLDRVHMLISIPPKHAVSQGGRVKSTIQIFRVFLGHRKNFVGQHFWGWRYYVSTVGVDEETIRAYIQEQEKRNRPLFQMNLFGEVGTTFRWYQFLIGSS